MRHLVLLLLCCLGIGWAAPALSWGNAGHRTVCEIAWRNLTPTARAEVNRLLAAHPVIPVRAPQNLEFGWSCTYPDNPVPGGPGRRSPEHFVNYARTTAAVISASGCGAAPSCVITGIFGDYARLRTLTASDADRAEALMYLGHWFGDIHQPLHSSFADDQGGNEVDSRGLCTRSLHSTWDTCILVQRAYGDDPTPSIEQTQAVAAAWSAGVSDVDRAVWLSTAPWQWSAESYAITIRSNVRYCAMTGLACQYGLVQMAFDPAQPRTSVLVDQAYMDMAMPDIQRRITQAGVRLAHWLNYALDPVYRGEPGAP
jgi:hypothetical protein